MTWTWRLDDGPFGDEYDSRDAAVDDARENAPGRTVLVGEVVDVVPVDYVGALVDVDTMMERMDEAVDLDGPVFEVDDGGEETLRAILRAWVQTHVTASIGRMTTNEEQVDV